MAYSITNLTPTTVTLATTVTNIGTAALQRRELIITSAETSSTKVLYVEYGATDGAALGTHRHAIPCSQLPVSFPISPWKVVGLAGSEAFDVTVEIR